MSDPEFYDPDAPSRLDDPTLPEVPARPMDHKTQPKKKDKGPIPARQGNGYYADHVTGDRLRSVTTILSGGVPKPALVHWAGNTVAASAVENLPALVAASRRPDELLELQRYVARAHTRKKDERADVGSAVHKMIECSLLGLELPVSIMVGEEEVRFDGPELAPFVENFRLFQDEWLPVFEASEMVVANHSHGYAGTLDFILSSDGLIGDALRSFGFEIPSNVGIMGDTKTGGEWDRITSAGHVHGVYPEAGLQESAYRKAEVCWLRDGTRVPMPATAEVGVVLHLRPEGYRLYPVLCGDDVYRYFRYAQVVDEWSSRMSSPKADRPIIGPALVQPESLRAVS
jgi:hypothetical protein